MDKYSEEDKFPSIYQQARNLQGAVKRVARAAAGGEEILAGDEEKERRMNVCRKCRHMSSKGRCSQCGCFIVFKSGLKTEECPIGKW